MKFFFILLTCLALENAACKKKSNDNCSYVTITQLANPCGGWAIKVNIHTYPSNTIPDMFKHEGTVVCADYELFEDMRLCACCGGTWADIKSMKYPIY